MQLNVTTDYAVRTVVYLAMHEGDCCSAADIEEKMVVPSGYLHKATKGLKEAGIVGTVQGPKGGYVLLKDPEDLTLYDVIACTEDTMEINACLGNDGFCNRHAQKDCPVRKAYCLINDSVHDAFKSVTIASILHKH